uniref:Ribonuclease inhibitor n=1 Tax=Anthurium amnicola TaxID=1678845 RepID=A0A1D1YNP9_9ARAE
MGDTPPALLRLCVKAIARTAIILDGYSRLQDVFDLPSDLFDCLLKHLPPLALQKLHEAIFSDMHGPTVSGICDERKRRRYSDFNRAWQLLFRLRWPNQNKQIPQISCIRVQDDIGSCEHKYTIEWQQLYWEAHLQNCLDEASEKALLPAFDGCIEEITMSNIIMEQIGCSKDICNTTREHAKLSYHCQKFGCYARCLRLQNVLCVRGTCELLRASKLQDVTFRNVRSETHVDEACMLLKLNKDTLLSLKFVHCRFSFSGFNKICSSLYYSATSVHGIQCFSVTSSSIFNCEQSSIPSGLLDFLSSGRSLCCLKFCDVCLGPKNAKMIFSTLQESSSGLINLDISDDNIAGWLANVDTMSACFSPLSSSSSSSSKVSLKSLRVLNLRGNNLGKDDAEDLRCALVHMPYLKRLDLSDNPLTDDGIRSLIPYFLEAFEKTNHLSDIKIENCSLSSRGVIQLLESIQNLREPLHSVSIADNNLDRYVGAPLAKFLGTSCVKELNIEDVGLGPLGFQDLENGITKRVELMYINISKNRGRMKAADFVSKLILHAPELSVINAGYNLMPPESFPVICNALKHSKGKLERLDLTGNNQLCKPTPTSVLEKFYFRGKAIVVLPSLLSTAAYDDDP